MPSPMTVYSWHIRKQPRSAVGLRYWKRWTVRDAACNICRAFFGLIMFLAIFICTAGTLLEIVGVYQNCTCLANIPYWFDDSTRIILNTDPTQVSVKSLQFWSPTGWSLIGFTLTACLAGWWYQRTMRKTLQGRGRGCTMMRSQI
jgi:hypothetical protein